MSLVAHVGHVVTYYAQPKWTGLTPFLTKKLSKTVKKGYPLFLPVFGEACGHFGPPPTSKFRLEVRKKPPGDEPPVDF